MPKQLIVPGHTLWREGASVDHDQWTEGRGGCSCGTLSPKLPSTKARQRWHREHKLEVIAAESVACDWRIIGVWCHAVKSYSVQLYCYEHGGHYSITTTDGPPKFNGEGVADCEAHPKW